MIKRAFKTEKEYRKHPAISQSALGYLDQHPKYYYYKVFTKSKEEDKDFFRIGSAVDAYLTDSENFHKQFVKASGYVPTEKMKLLCKSFFDYRYRNKIDYDNAFQMAFQESGYKSSMKTIKDKFELKANQTYIKELKDSQGKTLLSSEEYDIVRNLGMALKNSEHTREFFNKKYQSPDKEYLYQFSFTFTCGGRECKGLADLLIVDHKKKQIQIVDLKTTGKSNLGFKKSFLSFRYYLQAAFYTYGINQMKNRYQAIHKVDLSDYTILPFLFVVAETGNYNLPMIYQCTDNDLHVGRYGGEDKFGRKYKGFEQLLEELSWHERNNYWDMEKSLCEEGMFRELDCFIQVTKT